MGSEEAETTSQGLEECDDGLQSHPEPIRHLKKGQKVSFFWPKILAVPEKAWENYDDLVFRRFQPS
jgi:hypothetical protein